MNHYLRVKMIIMNELKCKMCKIKRDLYVYKLSFKD